MFGRDWGWGRRGRPIAPGQTSRGEDTGLLLGAMRATGRAFCLESLGKSVTASLKQNSRIVQFTHLQWTVQWFLVHLEHFYRPQKKPVPLAVIPPSLQP